MNEFDLEIARVKQTLRGKFVNEADKRYWEDKLKELEIKKQTYLNNQDYFKSYEKGVKAFKQYGWKSNY